MELRRLRYFVGVAEERHVARAAGRLHIAAPSLSQQIRALERDLHAVLVDRSPREVQLCPREVQLTPADQVLLRMPAPPLARSVGPVTRCVWQGGHRSPAVTLRLAPGAQCVWVRICANSKTVPHLRSDRGDPRSSWTARRVRLAKQSGGHPSRVDRTPRGPVTAGRAHCAVSGTRRCDSPLDVPRIARQERTGAKDAVPIRPKPVHRDCANEPSNERPQLPRTSRGARRRPLTSSWGPPTQASTISSIPSEGAGKGRSSTRSRA